MSKKIAKNQKAPKLDKSSDISDLSTSIQLKNEELSPGLVSMASSALTTTRSLLDLALHCKDGILRASSHLLAQNSVVFERMFFSPSTQQMEESLTNIVHLDEVVMADMTLLIQFCRVHDNPATLVSQLPLDHVITCISVAHCYEFTFALKHLCVRLIQLVSIPTSQQLQFADRLGLISVVTKWALNCESLQFYNQFVRNLAEFPVSKSTLDMFATVHMEHILTSNAKYTEDIAGYKIVIKTTTGDTITLSMHFTDFIYIIKAKIENLKGFPQNEQRLLFAGRELDDTHTLEHYNIQRDSTLHLVLRHVIPVGRYQIRVNSITGETTTFDVDSSNTIANIRTKFQNVTHISNDQHKLLYGSIQLLDAGTLASYSIGRLALLRFVQ